VAYDGTPAQVFKNYKELKEIGLMAPQVTYILHDLKEAGFNVDTSVTTLDGTVDEILKCLKNQE
jgi:energy-coupling factor transport system ATP-binding protein